MASSGDEGLASTLLPLAASDDGLAPLTVADLEDGPWCPHAAAPGRFDADWFRVRRIDVRLRVEALPAEFRGAPGPLFSRAGTAAQAAPRWVRDRTLTFSVAVGR